MSPSALSFRSSSWIVFSLDELIDSIRKVSVLQQQTRRVVTEVPHAHTPSSAYSKNRKAKIFSTFSLKGGVGRTMLAANLAVAIRNRNPEKEVAVIDGNLLHGDLGVVMNATRAEEHLRYRPQLP